MDIDITRNKLVEGPASCPSGMINPCRFGDQCEWHSCYCNSERSGYRKCHCSWYTGGLDPDRECEYYDPNPYWQEVGDFYKSRDATFAYMKDLGLVEEEEEEDQRGGRNE